MPKFNYNLTGFPSCCGLEIVHEMWMEPKNKYDAGMSSVIARVAVTAPHQIDVIERLKAEDFKEVGTFEGNGGYMLTLWLRQRDYQEPEYEDDDYDGDY